MPTVALELNLPPSTLELLQTRARQSHRSAEELVADLLTTLLGQKANADSTGGVETLASQAFDEVIDLLSAGPSPEEIVGFHSSSEIQERAHVLLGKNREGRLTIDEEAELDRFETLDYLVTRVKARAQRHLTGLK